VNRTIIVGAGPAGLTAAYELGRLGLPAVVLEKGDDVGGISRTVVHKGYRFDIGGHRFYTKMPEVLDLWTEWLADDLLERTRMSRIYYNGTFFDYPLRHVDALSKLGPVEAVRIAASYLRSRISPSSEETNFEDWVVNRFKNLDLAAAIRNALTGRRSIRGEVISSLIDRFTYPRLGPGMMWNRCRERATELGNPTHTGLDVNRIVHNKSNVSAVVAESADGPREFTCSGVISTMPIVELIRALDPPPPTEVLEAAGTLRYRDFLTVVLIVDRAEVFPDNWIYIHSPDVRLGRVQNFKNWSPEMVPDDGTTSLGLEYFVQRGDELWCSSDQELRELGTVEMARLGMLEPAEVIDATVVRQPCAYPMYDAHYREALDVIRAYLATIDNLATIGRNGQHRYNNQDHSMMTGLMAARNVAGATRDVWAVNVDQAYSEEDVRPSPEEEVVAVPASARPDLETLVYQAFARFDPVALGAATSAVAAAGLSIATAVLLLQGGDPVGPTLSLLGNYLLGYEASWGGAVIGFFEAAAAGFLFGNVLARIINMVVDQAEGWFVRECELRSIADPLSPNTD